MLGGALGSCVEVKERELCWGEVKGELGVGKSCVGGSVGFGCPRTGHSLLLTS